MLRSLAIEARTYPSFGRCIFCGSNEKLTDEHIIPLALSGIGEQIIRHGSCNNCNSLANKTLENPALQNDLLLVRNLLNLKRRRRGKLQKSRKMPPVATRKIDIDTASIEEFDSKLSPESYPPLYIYVKIPPAGLLTGIDRSGGLDEIRVAILNLGTRRETFRGPGSVELTFMIGATESMVAKMAYCYAVAEKGLYAFDYSMILDLLMNRRNDIFNFVGSTLVTEHLPMLRLHKFYFRERGKFTTVIVHLFASFGGPKYEVVIGEKK